MSNRLVTIMEAVRAGWSAGRAVMAGQVPVLVDDVLAAESCSCAAPRVVLVHSHAAAGPFNGPDSFYASCYEGQRDLMIVSALGMPIAGIDQVLDLLAEEADRRDGVRRGPR